MTSPQPFSNERHPLYRTQSLQPHESNAGERQSSISSDSSNTSQVTALSVNKRSLYKNDDARAAASASSLASISSLGSTLKQQHFLMPNDLPLRQPSPSSRSPTEYPKQRHVRQHSQGFFEPSLPTASYSSSPAMGGLTASQIAAQAAMHVQNPQHSRRRSQTIPEQLPVSNTKGIRKPSFPPPRLTSTPSARNSPPPHSADAGGGRVAATSAASAAYPRSPLYPPVVPFAEPVRTSVFERDPKQSKEKTRRKIFSKPKAIITSKDKDTEKKSTAISSPNKMGTYSVSTLSRLTNPSTTSLSDPSQSGSSSLYSSANVSTSTLVPTITGVNEKEKSRHHFLTRQKNKLKDKEDQLHLGLSSASSNSRPLDPTSQPLYSFAPSSPAPNSAFDKSISGLDLRHGGRALREKRKQDKTAAAAASGFLLPAGGTGTPIENSFRDGVASDWLSPGNANGLFGPPSGASGFMQAADSLVVGGALSGFGLPNMTPDDAWPLLQARLLSIFEGEDLRTPIEDFNRLVSVHIKGCIQRHAPSIIIEDLRELLVTGFSSLDQTLRQIPDEKLVPNLVEMWLYVFGTILPFIQAVFLPLDLEFKGRGPLMNQREAIEFWGASLSATPGATKQGVPVGNLLDVRTLVLLTFRDIVILPRHAALLSIFSRLSLDSINALPLTPGDTPLLSQQQRPGTAASSSSLGAPTSGHTNLNPAEASFTSQSSTLLDSNSASIGARSRATSNTSAGSFHSTGSQRHVPGLLVSLHPHGLVQHHQGLGQVLERSSIQTPAPVMDSAKVTETAGRMLQCVSVLAGLQGAESAMQVGGSGQGGNAEDEETVARKRMEQLAKELKLNWLGRGRTGRNRRGFVGTRMVKDPEPVSQPRFGIGIGVAA